MFKSIYYLDKICCIYKYFNRKVMLMALVVKAEIYNIMTNKKKIILWSKT